MGGHHHVEVPKVPDPCIYKVEDSPELMDIQKRLAAKGLKDPWARNSVWRVVQMNKGIKHPNWYALRMITYGWQFWVPLVGITIAVEHFLGIDYHGHSHDHGHDEKHD